MRAGEAAKALRQTNDARTNRMDLRRYSRLIRFRGTSLLEHVGDFQSAGTEPGGRLKARPHKTVRLIPVIGWVSSISQRFRKKRMERFAREFALTEATRVLDVGGVPETWALLDRPPRVTLLNT